MAVVTWLCLVVASLLRTRGWTPRGMLLAFGNRDDLAEPTPLAARAARTATNTLENFVLFSAIALVANAVEPNSVAVQRGAELFFWSRILYIPVYYAGVKYLRTAVWMVSVVALAGMVAAMLGHA
jgi:uncharacterized MAPEG superfamily protein